MCLKNNYDKDRQITELNTIINELAMWREGELKEKFEYFDNFSTTFSGKFRDMVHNMEDLERNKTDLVTFAKCEEKFDNLIEQLDIKLDQTRDQLLTLEQYTERYVPI